MIKTAEIISDESKEDEIGVNNTVEVRFEEDGTVETYKIVTTMRGNSWRGWSARNRLSARRFSAIRPETGCASV